MPASGKAECKIEKDLNQLQKFGNMSLNIFFERRNICNRGMNEERCDGMNE